MDVLTKKLKTTTIENSQFVLSILYRSTPKLTKKEVDIKPESIKKLISKVDTFNDKNHTTKKALEQSETKAIPEETLPKPEKKVSSKQIKEELDKKKAKELEKKKKLELERKLSEKKRQREIDAQTIVSKASYNDPSLQNPQPKYPIISRKEGESGEVILLIKVGKDGKPIDIIVHKSSGFQRLDNASMYAVKVWNFKPAKNKLGFDVDSVIQIPFIFKLDNSKI